MGLALACAPLLVALAPAGALVDLGVTTEARTRGLRVERGPAETIVQAELSPRVALVARSGATALSAEYTLRLLSPDVLGTAPGALRPRAELLNVLALRAEAPAARTATLALGLDGAWGWTDLLDAKVWTPQAVPTTARLEYVSSTAGLALGVSASRRTRVSADAAAYLSGGADAASRVIMPMQRGVRAGLSLGHDLGRRDGLELRVSGTQAWLDGGSTSAYAVVAGTWRHQVTRQLGTSTGVGIATTVRSEPQRELAVAAMPWAELVATWALAGARPSTSVAVRLEPTIDRLSGATSARAECAATVGWRPREAWHLAGRATGALLRPLEAAAGRAAEGTVTVGAAELRASRDAGPLVIVHAGVYGRLQRADAPTLPTFLEWGTFIGASARPRRGVEVGSRGRTP